MQTTDHYYSRVLENENKKKSQSKLCAYCSNLAGDISNEICSECYFTLDENGKRFKPNFKYKIRKNYNKKEEDYE